MLIVHYNSGVRAPYYPKMMLIIILYGYTQKEYTSCENCSDCSLKELCTKAKGNRQVHNNPVYEKMKGKAKTALEDETLAALYARHKIDVESVFDNLKGNLSFTRFLLRGLKKDRTIFIHHKNAKRSA